jgi:uncharacterized radical SAM superfamily Fe-S cluster-containing enzyme
MKPIKTTGCCPECGKVLPALKVTDGTYVYLERACPEHGDIRTLVSRDSKRFFDKRFVSPGKEVYDRQTKRDKGCPGDCGLCPDHKQHMCSSLIEITGRCNLQCPVCFHGDNTSPDITFEEFKDRLNVLMKTENGKLDVLQISGGEPLLHRGFTEIFEYAVAQNINRVLVNTNGLALIRDRQFYELIRRHKDRAEVYLQFDGFDSDTNVKLRGRDLTAEKISLIKAMDRDDIRHSLAVTVLKSNLNELKDIVKLACATPNMTGITFQRFAAVSRGKSAGYESVLQEDIIQAVADSGFLKYSHIVPLPCSHENCTSISFLFVSGKDIYSMAELIDFEKHQDIMHNKIGFESIILDYMRDNILCDDGCCSGFMKNMPVIKKLKEFTAGQASKHGDMKILRLLVKNFMDASTFDAERAEKCCFGISTGNGKIMPFCVNNVFHRGA